MGEQTKRYREWWIGGFFTLLIIGFTLIVWWEQKSGGACSQQYQSQNAENSSHPLSNAFRGFVSEDGSPQEAEQPSVDSESYFCRLIAPTNLPTDYLVLVGIGGVFIAVSSLQTINKQTAHIARQAVSMRRQTTILRESAAAAKDSADALVSAERAWLLAEMDHPERPHTYYEYTLYLRNHGSTPARIEGIFWDVKAIDSIGELPPISSFGLPELCPQFIAPKGAHEINAVFPNKKVSDEKWSEIVRDQTGGKYVICYGYVKYSGIFKGERCSWFCFGYNGLLDWFVPIGPDEYNKAT